MPNERAGQRYPGAVERFVADIFTQGIPAELDKDKPVLIACASGRRAVIAASRLTAHGYDVRVLNPGGIPDIMEA
jgi:rhodanese-related sulfurtransferase